jgi:hypothetical protein
MDDTRMGPEDPASSGALVRSKDMAAARAVSNADKPLAKYGGNAEPILTRLRQGETAREIAADVGVSHQALYEFLLRNAPEDWRWISASNSLSRMEKAEQAVDDAPDQVAVSRARESHSMARWSLERVARGMYGDNKDAQSGVTIQVIVQRDGGVTIEGEQ